MKSTAKADLAAEALFERLGSTSPSSRNAISCMRPRESMTEPSKAVSSVLEQRGQAEHDDVE